MTDRLPLAQLERAAPFAERHIGPSADEQAKMLAVVGYGSLEELVADAIPDTIKAFDPLDLPAAATEAEVLAELRGLAARNRLLTSLLDESTAAAEAMALCHRAAHKDGAFVIDADCHPQTIEVVRARAQPLGVEVLVADLSEGLPDAPLFGVLAQYPGSSGAIRDLTGLVEAAHECGALVALAADPLALTLLRPPGEMGADVAVGSSQRFGVPLWFGGPHAGFMAVRKGLE